MVNNTILGSKQLFPVSSPAQDGPPFSALLPSQNKAEGKLPQAKLSVALQQLWETEGVTRSNRESGGNVAEVGGTKHRYAVETAVLVEEQP